MNQDNWQVVDQKLRALGRRKAAYDADEARWLVAGREARVHEPQGFASYLEYLERVLGYTPRVARERLRVADALAALPATSAALAAGELMWSAARELCRVTTGETEHAWLAAARGKTVRQIEELVAGREPGDLPGDDRRIETETHVLRLEVSGETYAAFREACQALTTHVGHRLDDDDLVAAMAAAVLDATPGDRDPGRAAYQVAVTMCERCETTYVNGAGREVPVTDDVTDKIVCDAQFVPTATHVGAGGHHHIHVRASQAVAPAVRRQVLVRDRYRCRVPGCRTAAFLHVHHIRWQSHGGDHTADNLVTVCNAHHTAIHAHRLLVTGPGHAARFAHADGQPYGAPP